MWFVAKLSSNIRICGNGHRYSKSSDCPIWPICEAAKKPAGDLPKLAAPARRALENVGIYSLIQLAEQTEKNIANLHGMGPNAINKLRETLSKNGLKFKVL